MKSFFNYAKNRILYNIFRFLFFIIFLLIIFSSSVSAEDGIMNGSIFGTDISSSPQAQFYNNSHNSITTNFNQEFSYIPYYSADIGTESYLSFNLYTTLQSNVLYSLTIYLYGGVNIDISNNNIATGTYLNGANNNNINNTCIVDKYNYTSSYNIYYGINASTDYPSDTVTGAIYITFVPTCNGNYINVPIKFTSSPFTTYFYGYNLQTIGLTDGLTSNDIQNVINNSGLATANKLNEVNNSVNTIKSEISGMQDKQQETNNKLDEANQTSKGIWDTLKNLPKTIIDGFLDLLLKVFVPEDDFFSNWFDEVKSMFEEQLGFLATPFTIIIEFIERFLELNSSTDIIINIPDITVPNFENITLINATSFNWSSLLNSKDSLKNLWTLYLDFIDVFLILNFIGLCSSIYGRIFGGDTSNFEYYTVEDTYTVNDSTGEVTNHRLNQRKTTRKKVN